MGIWINVLLPASQKRGERIESEQEKHFSDSWTTATKREIDPGINGKRQCDTHTHKMEHYEILPCGTTWMNLEDTM